MGGWKKKRHNHIANKMQSMSMSGEMKSMPMDGGSRRIRMDGGNHWMSKQVPVQDGVHQSNHSKRWTRMEVYERDHDDRDEAEQPEELKRVFAARQPPELER